MKQMRAASPTPIQKMEGIKSAAYRTDNAGGIRDGIPEFPAMTDHRRPKTRN